MNELVPRMPKPKLRWYQFSLRSLLAVTTAFAIILGAWSWWSRSCVMTLTRDNFDQCVIQSRGLFLVEFHANWCGPCRQMDPVVAELARECRWTATVGRVDVDTYAGIARHYSVTAIPTFLLFRDGQLIGKQVGLTTKEALIKFLRQGNAAGAAARRNK